MERFRELRPLPEGIWSYDTIAFKGHIGSVRELLLVVTESGKEIVPTTLEYRQNPYGDRQSRLFEGRFSKEFVDYGKVGFYNKGEKQDFEEYILWDEQANISILALPLDPKTRVFSAKEALERFLDYSLPQTIILKKFVEFFPDKDLGLLGSCANLFNQPSSDLDLFVYGGRSFEEVAKALRDSHVRAHLGIRPLPEEIQNKSAENYSKRFGISFERAKRIVLLRNRYLVEIGGQNGIKVSITGCFDKKEYQLQTVLGSRKIRKVQEEGLAVETHNSASLPREYIVEIVGQQVRVIAMQEVLKMMVETGDKVELRGTLREKDGVEFISLEDYEDIIIAL
ncbi:MAG: nucleotidyltransferase domain-containing protein [Patescibacteria group bacterium]